MPIYEYEAEDTTAGCEYCSAGFEIIQRIADPKLTKCPGCGSNIVRRISKPSVGLSKSGLDQRAKAAGFHKLKRLGKGEYEKKY